MIQEHTVHLASLYPKTSASTLLGNGCPPRYEHKPDRTQILLQVGSRASFFWSKRVHILMAVEAIYIYKSIWRSLGNLLLWKVLWKYESTVVKWALAGSAPAVWAGGLREGTSSRRPPFPCFILILINSRKAKEIWWNATLLRKSFAQESSSRPPSLGGSSGRRGLVVILMLKLSVIKKLIFRDWRKF